MSPSNRISRATGFVLLVIAVLGLIVCAYADKRGDAGWRDVRAFRGGPLQAPADATSATLETGSGEIALRMNPTTHIATLPAQPLDAGHAVFGRDHTSLNVSIVDPAWAYVASCATLLLALGLLVMATGDTIRRSLAAVLSEGGDAGLSLARVQLLIWLIVALVVFGGLSTPLLALPDLDSALAALFGLSGLTTMLGAAASPSSARGVADPDKAALRDVVEDFDGALDITRLQCLVVNVVSAAVVLASFLTTLRVPTIPPTLLAVLAASQGTYLATKAVKANNRPVPQTIGEPK